MTPPEEIAASLVETWVLIFRVRVSRWPWAQRSLRHRIARAICEERYNYDGAMADLDSAIDVLIKRINGEKDLASAAEWVRLNYPKKAKAIRATPEFNMQETPCPK